MKIKVTSRTLECQRRALSVINVQRTYLVDNICNARLANKKQKCGLNSGQGSSGKYPLFVDARIPLKHSESSLCGFTVPKTSSIRSTVLPERRFCDRQTHRQRLHLKTRYGIAQCYDLETKVLQFECTQVHLATVSVLCGVCLLSLDTSTVV